MTTMNLTLKKDDLIAELEAKRTEVFDNYYAEYFKELEEYINNAITEAEIKDATIAWYRDVAEGLEEGRYQLNGSGKVRGGQQGPPAKPKIGGPNNTRLARIQRRFYVYSKEDAEVQLEQYKARREEHVKPLDSALKLLRMSSDVEVTINGGDYQKLLAL